ncbi:unnamed protein product [Diamesa serratosioi]
MSLFVYKFLKKYFLKLVNHNPTLQDLFFSSHDERKKVRKVVLFIYGSIFGWFFGKFILSNFGFPASWLLYIELFSSLLVGFGKAFSSQFRCISTLVWIGIFGKAGRNILKTIIFTLVITGPIENIILNSKEVIRVFSCSSYLVYNLTKTRLDLMVKPFTNAFSSMDEQYSTIQKKFQEIDDIVMPIFHEVEGEDNYTRITRSLTDADRITDAKNYVTMYKTKLKKRCEKQLNRGAEKCQKTFSKAFNECMDKMPSFVNHLVCWPMKIDMICDLAGGLAELSSVCDPSDVVDDGFGEDYLKLKEIEGTFMTNESNIDINFETADPKDLQIVKSLNQTSKAIQKDFNEKVKLLDYCYYFIHKVMAFVFVLIIYDAIRYHDSYLSELDFKNYFITDYFKKIDLRRFEAGRSHLFPLRRIECKYLVDTNLSRKIVKEFKGYLGVMLTTMLQILITTLLILLNFIYYESLDLIKRHSLINYVQTGIHDFNITVDGTGFIADMMRSTVDGFNVKVDVNVLLTNEPCLPKPLLIENWRIVRIYLLFVFNIYLIYNQVYIYRAKRFICAYYYPKREKQRILHLYNKLLKRRRGLFKHLLVTVKDKMKLNQVLVQKRNCIQRFIANYNCCRCLKVLKCARRNCFICGELEPRRQTIDYLHFILCYNQDCDIIYCEECWLEVDLTCLVCRYRKQYTKNMDKSHLCDSDYYTEYHQTDDDDGGDD